MIKPKKIILLFLCLFILEVNLRCETPSTGKIKITTTTSLLGLIVKEIGKERIDVVTIVPAGMCPGHFDIKPGSVKSLTDSRVFLNHGWEKWVSKLLDAAENKPALHTVDAKGNLMVPETNKRAAENIAALLCSLDQDHKAYYTQNLALYKTVIDSIGKLIKEEARSIQDTKVVSSELQVEFLKWVGLDVVMTYGRAEDLTPKKLSQLINKAKKEGVKLVIDNLQSGPDTGMNIAEEIGAKQINLTNFPLKGSYPDALVENFKTIIQALQ